MGRAGEEVAQKHSVFLSTVGEPRGEDTTHSRSRTHLTNRENENGEEHSMGQLMRASGTYNLQKTRSRSCLMLAACLSVWWDLCSGKGLIM